jgi:hypothetical protein
VDKYWNAEWVGVFGLTDEPTNDPRQCPFPEVCTCKVLMPSGRKSIALQICLVYINTLFIQEVLADPAWRDRMTAEDWRGLTPLILLRGRLDDRGRDPNTTALKWRSIDWELIRQQYDQMIKYTTALRLGTAETEAILRRFTKNNVQHPTYNAFAETGKGNQDDLPLPVDRRQLDLPVGGRNS